MSDKPEATIIAPEKISIEYSINDLQTPEAFARKFVDSVLKGDIITAALLANQVDTDDNKIEKITLIIDIFTQERDKEEHKNITEQIDAMIDIFADVLEELRERNKEPTNTDNNQEGAESIQDERS